MDSLTDIDPNEAGGIALTVGFLLVVLVLYRDPARGFEAATAGLQSALYFLVFPALGLLAGIYTYAGGPFSAVGSFLLGSYLGIVGLALTFGALLTRTPVGLPLAVGVIILPLGVVAVVTSLLQLLASFRVGVPGSPSD